MPLGRQLQQLKSLKRMFLVQYKLKEIDRICGIMTIITNIFLIAHVAVKVRHLQWKYKVLTNKTIILAKKLKDFHSCMHYPTFAKNHTWFYIPSRILRSASERHLVVPSQRGSKSLSRTFSFTVPGWWNDLPTPIRNAGSLSIYKQQLKTHLFQHY